MRLTQIGGALTVWQYKGGAFKVAMLDRWMVLLSGNALVDELRKLPEDEMSFRQAFNQVYFTLCHTSYAPP